MMEYKALHQSLSCIITRITGSDSLSYIRKHTKLRFVYLTAEAITQHTRTSPPTLGPLPPQMEGKGRYVDPACPAPIHGGRMSEGHGVPVRTPYMRG